jgi:DNA-directed RNA polymerase specialized sigma24 family protein
VAVAYRFVLDLAYREIGAAMDTTEEAARRNVHEGLKRLREDSTVVANPVPAGRSG